MGSMNAARSPFSVANCRMLSRGSNELVANNAVRNACVRTLKPIHKLWKICKYRNLILNSTQYANTLTLILEAAVEARPCMLNLWERGKGKTDEQKREEKGRKATQGTEQHKEQTKEKSRKNHGKEKGAYHNISRTPPHLYLSLYYHLRAVITAQTD